MENIVSWVQSHWVQITVIFLAVNTFLKAIRDAIDKTPATDDNAFEKFVSFMSKLAGYLITGKRA